MGVIFSPIVAALNPIAIHLGPIAVHWYGVIIATGVIIAVTLAVREGRRRGINPDDIYDMILWALPAALIAARLYYVIFNWSYSVVHGSFPRG